MWIVILGVIALWGWIIAYATMQMGFFGFIIGLLLLYGCYDIFCDKQGLPRSWPRRGLRHGPRNS